MPVHTQRFDNQGRRSRSGRDFFSKWTGVMSISDRLTSIFWLHSERFAFYEIRLSNAHYQTRSHAGGRQAGCSFDPPRGRS